MKIAVIQLERYLRAYDLLCGYMAPPLQFHQAPVADRNG